MGWCCWALGLQQVRCIGRMRGIPPSHIHPSTENPHFGDSLEYSAPPTSAPPPAPHTKPTALVAQKTFLLPCCVPAGDGPESRCAVGSGPESGTLSIAGGARHARGSPGERRGSGRLMGHGMEGMHSLRRVPRSVGSGWGCRRGGRRFAGGARSWAACLGVSGTPKVASLRCFR